MKAVPANPPVVFVWVNKLRPNTQFIIVMEAVCIYVVERVTFVVVFGRPKNLIKIKQNKKV